MDLKPLIDELTTLWNDGVLTYDVSLRQNIIMKAALMWTIDDFRAYGMMSGWMIAGTLGCPICMERLKAFTLKNSRKISYFFVTVNFPLDRPYMRNKMHSRNIVQRLHPFHCVCLVIWWRVDDLLLIHESQG